MNTPIMFHCENCQHPIESKRLLPNGKVLCPKCGHENTPPEHSTQPVTADIHFRRTYFGD